VRVDWSQTLFNVIDVGSFSALWYWIVLAVTWSTASHRVVGVPLDMVLRARRMGDGALRDLEEVVRISAGRILFIARESGLWLAGLATFGLTALGVLGFWYWLEFAQALFLPLTLVGLLSLSTAARIEAEQPVGEALCRLLLRHRAWTQGIGVVSIFVTALFGMFQNLASIRFL
jgi:hypothetical protein